MTVGGRTVSSEVDLDAGERSSSVALGLGEWICGPDGEGAEEWVIYGLGSCIGLILTERERRVSAMAHIVLPTSSGARVEQPAKYADTAVPTMHSALIDLGASEAKIVAYVVGGARILKFGGVGDIGRRNTERVREVLRTRAIPVVAECVGGTAGRTLRWKRREGIAVVSRVGQKEEVLTSLSCRRG